MFNLFRSKKKDKPTTSSNDKYGEIVIDSVKTLTKDAKAIYFKLPNDMSYQSGQFITLIFDIEGKSHRRAYSFCSSPTHDMAAIGVKQIEKGVISTHLCQNVKAGDTVKIMKPAGRFILNESHQNLIFVAGGSGITPIMSMLTLLYEQEPAKNILLIYANNDKASIMFEDELSILTSKNPNVKLVHVLKDTDIEDNKTVFKGLLNDSLLNDILKHHDLKSESDTLGCYICGPKPLLDIVNAYCSKVDIKNVYHESFTNFDEEGKKSTPTTSPAASGKVYNVKIHLNNEVIELAVPEGKKILEIAIENSIDLPFSCQEGVCEACKGKCMSGEIEMGEHDGLSEKEEAAGYILTCVSHPKSDNIEITYDE